VFRDSAWDCVNMYLSHPGGLQHLWSTRVSSFNVSSQVLNFLQNFSRVILLCLISSTAQAAPPQWVEGELIVKPKAGLSEAKFEKILNSSKGQSLKQLKQINARVIKVAPQAMDAVMKALSKNPNIDYVEKNPLIPPSAYTPNDPSYPDQWHLSMIQTSSAWDISTGNGITIAVLDAGVDGSHPDLATRMVPGRNVASNNNNTAAINVHGTAVAGAVAAAGDNATGVASVAWSAQIMPVRITNRTDGWANGSDMIDGILWAADNGAGVVNISYDIGSADAAMNDAAQYLRSKGGLLVMSAGNSNTDNGTSENPYIINVAATTRNDARASFSNYGNYIDVSAPGEDILTVWENGQYGWAGGTSFSSPIAAGVVALIKAANPNLTPDEVETVLKNSADDLGSNGWDKYFGHGRVNAAAAVLLANGGVTPDNEAPSISIASPTHGAVVGGDVSVNVTASDNEGVDRVELYAGGALVATDSTSPYRFSWDSSGKAGGAQIILEARAYDDAGNVRNTTITVSIIADDDTVAPLVTAPSAVNKEATGPLTSVNLGSASAVDAVDGAVAVTANFSGPFAVGQHTVVWSATDVAGNTGTANQSIRITDTTAPVVTAPANIIVQASGSSTSVNLGQATAQDKVDGSVSTTPNNNGPFPVGVTLVTWRATDSSGNTGSASQTVTVSEAADITPPVISAPSSKTVEATGSLTSVNLGQATAVDDVDGTVGVSASDQGPFEVGVHSITWTARDQAGNQSTSNQTITVRDTTKPVISIPGDVTAGATGPFTEVNLGNVTAVDAVSGSITAVVSPAGPYASGVYTLTWIATDAAGNRGRATQKLTVKPQASLAVNQTVGEGSTVTVEVFLSGPAPAYPVSVPYSVSGTADRPEDHNATDGVITINSGTTGSRVFATVDDGFNGEDNETVVFQIQTPTNAVLGSRRKHTVTIIEGNTPPRVDLDVEQQGARARVVYTDAGLVEVFADVTDPDANDRHSFDWSATDNRLFDTGSGGADTFIVDPQSLTEGIYSVKVTVTDNGEPAESVSAEALISVSQPESTSPAQDQDGDGISDDDEGTGDADQDGVPDYLDAIDDPAVLQSVEAVSDRALLITEPGLRLRLGGTALAAGYYGAGISLRDIEAYANQAGGGVSASIESGLQFPGGLYDFEVAGLRQTGQSVKVVVPQAAKIGADAVYRKYDLNNGWQDFVEDDGNSIASAAGSRDSCPAPGATAYKAGLQQGHYCVQLTLQDGGPNDADGRFNGVIKDPGGVALSPQAADDVTSSTSSGGGGGGGGGGCTATSRNGTDPLLPLLVTLAALGIARRRIIN
jgi:thermitase